VSYLFLIYRRFSLLQLGLYFLVENNISSLLHVQKREKFTEKIKRCTIYSKTYVQSMAVHYALSWSLSLTATGSPVREAGESTCALCRESNGPAPGVHLMRACLDAQEWGSAFVYHCWWLFHFYSVRRSHFFSKKRSLCKHRKLTVTNYAV
jgi:hypothetical protein